MCSKLINTSNVVRGGQKGTTVNVTVVDSIPTKENKRFNKVVDSSYYGN